MATFAALSEKNYQKFIAGFGISYILYWVTLLAVGWWTWEVTHSATWVSFMFFCDLFPALLITPFASSFADKGDRFVILRVVLLIQVITGSVLSLTAYLGALTPGILAAFIFLEGALIGVSQPAFFGLVNRLVSEENLSSAVAFISSLVQTTYIVGPLVASLVFSLGIEFAWLALGANAFGTAIYLLFLASLTLRTIKQSSISPLAPTTIGGALDGLRIFVTDKTVYQASVVIIVFAIIQRPLLNLLPAINGEYSVVDAAYFTILTASFMLGSVLSSLYLSHQNNPNGPATSAVYIIGLLCLSIALLFLGLENGLNNIYFASVMLLVIGFCCSQLMTGSNIVLQNKVPENYRSRVLGNSFMITRAFGAVSVVVVGVAIDGYGMYESYIGLAALSLLLYLLLCRKKFANDGKR